MPRTSLVFTFISDDRPGLVESISDTVARHQGNWLDSRMSQLAGKFAGIIRVGVDEEFANDLTRALQALRDEGMSIIVEQSGETFEPADSLTLFLNMIGLDRPGIVHEVSQALAKENINVVEMSTDITSAAMTGEPLFNADAEIHVPSEIDVAKLSEMLDQIADKLSLEIDLVDQPPAKP